MAVLLSFALQRVQVLLLLFILNEELSSVSSNSNLVMIESVQTHLQQLALAVADGRAVLLEGDVMTMSCIF